MDTSADNWEEGATVQRIYPDSLQFDLLFWLLQVERAFIRAQWPTALAAMTPCDDSAIREWQAKSPMQQYMNGEPNGLPGIVLFHSIVQTLNEGAAVYFLELPGGKIVVMRDHSDHDPEFYELIGLETPLMNGEV